MCLYLLMLIIIPRIFSPIMVSQCRECPEQDHKPLSVGLCSMMVCPWFIIHNVPASILQIRGHRVVRKHPWLGLNCTAIKIEDMRGKLLLNTNMPIVNCRVSHICSAKAILFIARNSNICFSITWHKTFSQIFELFFAVIKDSDYLTTIFFWLGYKIRYLSCYPLSCNLLQ